MSTAGPLGEYLRARRELIGPGDVGLPAHDCSRSRRGVRRAEREWSHGRRRVPGLRLNQAG
ncbi:hypothetical protein AB0B57_05650 [Micromonospora sp. NPDC049101]|uniref:hypothetical protein n=1 Tax=unclassified Micromonospora TaxID=2617518 RepID=UPI0033FA4B2F